MDRQLQALYARRSVRAYTGAPVDDALVTELLEAAMAAPSARATDPWRFIVVRDAVRLQAIADLLPYGKMLVPAGLGITVCGDVEEAHRKSESFLLQDVSAATQNLLLAASMLGLGTCWLGVHPIPERVEGLRRIHRLPAHIIPVAVIAVGHPDETPEARTRYDQAKVHQEVWGDRITG